MPQASDAEGPLDVCSQPRTQDPYSAGSVGGNAEMRILGPLNLSLWKFCGTFSRQLLKVLSQALFQNKDSEVEVDSL